MWATASAFFPRRVTMAPSSVIFASLTTFLSRLQCAPLPAASLLSLSQCAPAKAAPTKAIGSTTAQRTLLRRTFRMSICLLEGTYHTRPATPRPAQGDSPVAPRSRKRRRISHRRGGGNGRRKGLKIPRASGPSGFDSQPRHFFFSATYGGSAGRGCKLPHEHGVHLGVQL